MKSLRRLLVPLLLATPALSLSGNPAFDTWAESFARDWVKADPITATSSQYLPSAEQDVLDRFLIAKDFQYNTPLDPVARAARVERARRGLSELRRWSPSELTSVQRTSADFLGARLQDALRNAEFTEYRFVFEQFRGLQVGLVGFLTQQHPIRSARDVDNYLVRLAQVAPLLNAGIAEAQARATRGLLPPGFILKSTIDGIDRFLAPAPADNVFVTSLIERTGKLADLSVAERTAAVTSAEKIVTEAIRPAYERVKALLTDHAKIATHDAGLWRLPGGAEAYAAALVTNTTTDLTPDQIHAIGLREVAHIEGEMDKILRELGYTEGSIQARYDQLNAALQPPADPDPRPALLAEYTRMVRDAELRAQVIFDLRPKAPVEVRREPPFTEKSAAARYTAPALDGTRPGIFWVPLPGPDFAVARMRSLAYHEAVPGHHFQVTLQQESPQLPRFRALRVLGGLSAFAEGWGLYAERIADESGWYEGDPRGRLGYLSSMLFRARRLVVDTGLHAKKWTRQQAIDYGIPASEVERYVVMPGQACSYMIGQLKIVELREKARTALGPKFSLKEFHNLILRTGEVPLDVLAQVTDDWIAGPR